MELEGLLLPLLWQAAQLAGAALVGGTPSAGRDMKVGSGQLRGAGAGFGNAARSLLHVGCVKVASFPSIRDPRTRPTPPSYLF